MGVAHRGPGGWCIEFDCYIVLVPLMHGSSSLMDSLSSTSERLGKAPATFHSDP